MRPVGRGAEALDAAGRAVRRASPAAARRPARTGRCAGPVAADATGTIDRAGWAIAGARLALARSSAVLDGIKRRRPSAARGSPEKSPGCPASPVISAAEIIARPGRTDPGHRRAA
jgi:hypothetical protein